MPYMKVATSQKVNLWVSDRLHRWGSFCFKFANTVNHHLYTLYQTTDSVLRTILLPNFIFRYESQSCVHVWDRSADAVFPCLSANHTPTNLPLHRVSLPAPFSVLNCLFNSSPTAFTRFSSPPKSTTTVVDEDV